MLVPSFLATTTTTTLILIPALLLQPSHAIPTPPTLVRRIFGPSLDVLDSVVLFDAPAFQDASGGLTALMPAFVSLRQLNLAPATAALTSLLGDLGLSIGDKAGTFAQRVQLFAAVGLAGKEVDVSVGGCAGGQAVSLARTSGSPDLGQMLKTVPLGNCGTGVQPLTGNVKVSASDSRQFSATIFPSPPDGFGVISDIDDTVKITDVLDAAKAFKATFLDDPVPVPGMPAVYSALQASLANPQFVYVSGSPSQLYPFLRGFIGANYPAGPILLQNVTMTDLSQLKNLASPDGIEAYKLAMIDRVQGIYPGKKFLTVGDSTQKDPETYGAAFRKFGPDFVSCIWIRQFAGANNTAERFAAAFEGVPAGKVRLYNDSDIPSLSSIDVAGGNC